MPKTLVTYSPTLMSPRTKKYFEAMIQEGRNFDYDRWLKRVREQEAEAKLAEATGTSGELVATEANKPISTSDDQRLRPDASLRLMTKIRRLPKAPRWSPRQAKAQAPKARLRRRLEKICGAWDDFQANRARDGVYEYLAAVFALVMHYRVR
jgi:hypothetical protein